MRDIVEYHHGKTKSIYLNRVVGRHRYNCVADGDFDAGVAEGKKTG